MSRATEKQIDYCKQICVRLELEPPNYNSCQETFCFMQENVPLYKEAMKIETFKYVFSKVESCLTNKAIDFLKQNDDKIGIYIFWLNESLLYIGKTTSKNTHRILTSYESKNKEGIPVSHISFIEMENTADINILEVMLIEEFKPIFNKDCKSFDEPTKYKSGINIEELKKIEWEISKWQQHILSTLK